MHFNFSSTSVNHFLQLETLFTLDFFLLYLKSFILALKNIYWGANSLLSTLLDANYSSALSLYSRFSFVHHTQNLSAYFLKLSPKFSAFCRCTLSLRGSTHWWLPICVSNVNPMSPLPMLCTSKSEFVLAPWTKCCFWPLALLSQFSHCPRLDS